MGPAQAAALAVRLRSAVGDERVLGAIAAMPRERFVPLAQRSRAYENVALPIACGQTISQPLVVARMLETLRLQPDDRVLDIGTGSGYHAALLARLARHVWTIERHPKLSTAAQEAIASLGIDNITFEVGDGYQGLASQAPFDAINVAAAAGESVAETLEHQLAPGGRLVVPIGESDQHLMLSRHTPDGIVRFKLEPVRFVPLVPGPG
jgi:protein-L-isoaspartate(D-aspartate) O-methyltransferase